MTATLRKMQASIDANTDAPVSYKFVLGEELVPLNETLGQNIQLKFSGEIFCIHCDRKTKKSFSQGYCYPCFKKLAQCDMCIVKPETCILIGALAGSQIGQKNIVCKATPFICLTHRA